MDGDVASSDISLGTTAWQTCSSGLLRARHIPGRFQCFETTLRSDRRGPSRPCNAARAGRFWRSCG